MSMLYVNTSSKKSKKKSKKQIANEQAFAKMMSKYETGKKEIKKKNYVMKVDYRGRNEFLSIPSLDTRVGTANKKDDIEYTGDNMIGVATLHKSNGVPVFRQDDAIDISKMRR